MCFCHQERFSSLAPALSKWSSTIIALTLIAIGLFGLYDTYAERAMEPEYQLEVAGTALKATTCSK